MLSTTEYGSPTYSPKTWRHSARPKPPSSYSVQRYPTWNFYSAYPPPNGPRKPFRDCNKLLDFTRRPTTSLTTKIPRCHRLHYVPRILTWDWTALERLTGYERLQRFLLQNPISAIPASPYAVALYLYYAKLEKIDLGLLSWPQGYWNAECEKDEDDHIQVEKIMNEELEELISAEKITVKEEARNERLKGEQRQLTKPMSRNKYSGRYRDSVSSEGSSYSSPTPSNRLSVDIESFFERLSGSSIFDENVSNFSTSNFSNVSSSGSDEFSDELDSEEQREWMEVVEMNREREGLGWWATITDPDTPGNTMSDEREVQPDAKDRYERSSRDARMSKWFDAETDVRDQETELDMLSRFDFLGLDDDGHGAIGNRVSCVETTYGRAQDERMRKMGFF